MMWLYLGSPRRAYFLPINVPLSLLPMTTETRVLIGGWRSDGRWMEEGGGCDGSPSLSGRWIGDGWHFNLPDTTKKETKAQQQRKKSKMDKQINKSQHDIKRRDKENNSVMPMGTSNHVFFPPVSWIKDTSYCSLHSNPGTMWYTQKKIITMSGVRDTL